MSRVTSGNRPAGRAAARRCRRSRSRLGRRAQFAGVRILAQHAPPGLDLTGLREDERRQPRRGPMRCRTGQPSYRIRCSHAPPSCRNDNIKKKKPARGILLQHESGDGPGNGGRVLKARAGRGHGAGRDRSGLANGAVSAKSERDAGVVQWQNGSFPSCIRGFDSLRPLQSFSGVSHARKRFSKAEESQKFKASRRGRIACDEQMSSQGSFRGQGGDQIDLMTELDKRPAFLCGATFGRRSV